MVGLSKPTALCDTRLIYSEFLLKINRCKCGANVPLTGTRNKTPVTIEVKAVPLTAREYIFPSEPITKAPTAETISVLPGKNRLAVRLAAYAQQENNTMIGSCRLLQYCRLDREEHIEYMGTSKNKVHQGKGCLHHGQCWDRTHPENRI